MEFTCPDLGDGHMVNTIISDSDKFYKENKMNSFNAE